MADARLAQLVERKALNLVVVGSSPTVGGHIYFVFPFLFREKLMEFVFGFMFAPNLCGNAMMSSK